MLEWQRISDILMLITLSGQRSEKGQDRTGQQPSVGRAKHQTLGVLLGSIFLKTVAPKQDCAFLRVDDATLSFCACLKRRYLKQFENLLQ